MLIEFCSYCHERDIQAPDQTGFVDLAKANASGSIPATIMADDLSFNEIEDPNSIAGRPSDVFEQMQLGKSLLDRVPKNEKESE